MMRVHRSTLIALAMAAMLPAAHAVAQDDGALLREGLFTRDRSVSVTERPRPEYNPITMHFGSFSVLPSLSGSVEGNDNILATTDNRESDAIFRIEPAVTAKSNWSRHALSVYANVNSDFYAKHHSEETTDFLLGFDGRLDVAHDFGLASGASYERDTEPRTSSSSPQLATSPVQYDVARAYGEATYATNRFRFSGRLSVDDFTYTNVHTALGFPIDEKDRDHSTYTESGKIEYALIPDTSVFIQAIINERDYRNPQVGEVKRDSSGYTLYAGTNFDLTRLIRGEVAIGYLSQSYDASALYSKVSGFSFAGHVEWFPTQLTTVTVAGSRGVEDAGIPSVGGYTATVFSGTVDHELLRNVLLTGGVSYGKDDYQNYDRHDERVGETIGVKYLLNRALTLNAAYSHYNQNSSGTQAGVDYTVNRIYATLTYAF